MNKYVIHPILGLLALATIGVGVYSYTATASLKTDLAAARAETGRVNDDVKNVRASLSAMKLDVDRLDAKTSEQDQKANLAADNKKSIERAIKKDRVIQLQKNFQVGSWKVGCVVATSNTLNCIGEGFLDGEDNKESYEATVDQDGSYVWKQTY